MRFRRGRYVGVALLAILLLLVGTPVARAQPSDADKEAARIHFKAGEQYYLSAHYTQAINEFREAYRLSKAPALLFNIAQAYEKMGDLDNQREFLQRYVDSGKADPSEVPALKEKIRDLDAQVAARKTGTPVKPTPPRPDPPVVEPIPVEPEPEEGPRPYKTWKWIALGAGGGSLVLSALFLADASKMNQQIEDAVTDPPSRFTPELEQSYSRGQRDNALGVVFGVAGIGLITAGVIFYLMDKPTEAPRTTFVPVFTPTSAGAAAIVTF